MSLYEYALFSELINFCSIKNLISNKDNSLNNWNKLFSSFIFDLYFLSKKITKFFKIKSIYDLLKYIII